MGQFREAVKAGRQSAAKKRGAFIMKALFFAAGIASIHAYQKRAVGEAIAIVAAVMVIGVLVAVLSNWPVSQPPQE